MNINPDEIIKEAIMINKAYAYDIVVKENERLKESNKELLEALKEMIRWEACYDLRPEEIETFKDVVKQCKTAIYNAKKIL